MATHRIEIGPEGCVPDTTGRCYFETADVKLTTNKIFKHPVAVFANPGGGEAHGIYGSFEVPQNYVGSPAIKVVWTSPTTTGNVKWDFDYRAVGGDDTESLDQATFQEALTVTDAAPGAADRRLEASMSMTAGNLAAGDTVEFFLTREDGAGTDTLADNAIAHKLVFSYTDA